MGIVYIAVSDRMYYKDEDGEFYEFVKIGVTKGEETIETRMKSLNGTSTPYPLECLYALDVGDKARDAERLIHKNLDRHRIRKGKYKREFFKIGRDEARRHLEVLEIMGGRDVTPDERDTVVDEDDKRIMREGVNKRKAFNFTEVGIASGTELHFLGHDEITCEVVDGRRIRFRNKVTSLSNAAAIVLKEKGRNDRKYPDAVAGTRYWAYKGRTLDTIRIEKEGAAPFPPPVPTPASVSAKPQTSPKKQRTTLSGRVIDFSLDEKVYTKTSWQEAVIKVLESLEEHKDKIKTMTFPALKNGRQINNEQYKYIKDLDMTVATMSAKDGMLIIKTLKENEDFSVNIKLRYKTKTGEVKTI